MQILRAQHLIATAARAERKKNKLGDAPGSGARAARRVPLPGETEAASTCVHRRTWGQVLEIMQISVITTTARGRELSLPGISSSRGRARDALLHCARRARPIIVALSVY